MKLRQKLAVVLASAMVITAVPVTTMAKSKNELTKVVSIVDGSILNKDSKVFLNMEIEDTTEDSTTFFLKATDFEFDSTLYAKAHPEFVGVETTLKAAVNKTNFPELNGKKVQDIKDVAITLDGKQVTGATAKVKYESEQKTTDGYESVTITRSELVKVASEEVKAVETVLEKEDFTVGEDGKVTTDAAVAAKAVTAGGFEIKILSKSEAKVFVPSGIKAGVKISIPVYGKVLKGNPAIAVDSDDSVVTSGKYSLTGAEVVTDKVLAAKAGDAKNISVDGFGSIADITIEENVAGKLAGQTVTITLPNSSDLIFHKQYDKGADVTAEGTRGLAGEISKVKAEYFVDDKGNVDDKKLTITFPSTLGGKARGGVTLKGIQVQAEDKKGDVKTGEVKVTVASKDNMADTKLTVANVSDYGVSLTVDEVDELTAGQGTTKVKVKIKENAIDTLSEKRPVYFTIEEGRFVGLTEKAGFTLNADKDEIALDLTAKNDKGEKIFKTNEVNEFEFEVEIAAKATHKGPVVIKATSRSFEEDADIKVEVAKVTPAVEVTAEPIVVKAGLKSQVGGKIVIKETAEEKLAKNKEIRISSKDEKWGFGIEDAKIEVTEGDIEIKSEIDKKTDEIIITVKRTSDTASTITISDVKVTTDRTVPEGTFDFQVGGTAISDLNNQKYKNDKGEEKVRDQYEDALTVKNFVEVSTKNTEDLPNAAAAKEIVLTVGSTAYTVNGEAKTADAAAFIDANNRTMVPVRFVAEEFGKIDFGTVNGVGTVTVFKDGSVLQFQNGSNIMNKNGIAIPMDTTVVIKDGRTYVPFKYVADGLGINFSFDAATKSITFTNQSK